MIWIVAGLASLGAYLGLLQVHSYRAEAPLVVLYLGGPRRAPPVDPRTLLPIWAPPLVVDQAVRTIQDQRAAEGLPTLTLDTEAAEVLRTEVYATEGRKLLLATLRDAAALPDLATQARSADATLVLTDLPVRPLLDGIAGPLAILPLRWSDGVPGNTDLPAAQRVVGPWVDRRYRVGRVEVWFDDAVTFAARTVDLPHQDPDPSGSTRVGRGSTLLALDTIHLGQGGLGGVIAARVRRETDADVALVNHLSLRGGLDGDVDVTRLMEALPFHNEVVVTTLDGDALLALLAENARLDTRYLVVCGLHEVDGQWFDDDGRAADPARAYRVATVDYLAAGARGKRPLFLQGRDPVHTGIFTDRLAMDLLSLDAP